MIVHVATNNILRELTSHGLIVLISVAVPYRVQDSNDKLYDSLRRSKAKYFIFMGLPQTCADVYFGARNNRLVGDQYVWISSSYPSLDNAKALDKGLFNLIHKILDFYFFPVYKNAYNDLIGFIYTKRDIASLFDTQDMAGYNAFWNSLAFVNPQRYTPQAFSISSTFCALACISGQLLALDNVRIL
jgi:hypothetical protein